MNEPIGIHTICYAPGMAANVDPAFLPFDVSASPEVDRREIAHMLSFWRQGRHKDYAVSGLLSPRFTEKTGMSGRSFIDFIKSNPGYDVWLVNPFPQYHYISFNIWEHGEFWHPGLSDRANTLLTAAGLNLDVRTQPRSRPETLLFSNCWAGTPAFWDRFMGDIEALVMASSTLPTMLDLAPYHLDKPAPYFPFFFERYLTTFLTQNSDLRVCPMKYSFDDTIRRCGSEIGYVFLNDWGPIIDRWDQIGVYSDPQRQIFTQIQRFFGALLTWRHMKARAEAELGMASRHSAFS